MRVSRWSRTCCLLTLGVWKTVHAFSSMLLTTRVVNIPSSSVRRMTTRPDDGETPQLSRRRLSWQLLSIATAVTRPFLSPVWARMDESTISSSTSATWNEVRAPLQSSLETLQRLTENWERAVIDCTYADVPREWLETQNKALLLEKASVNALFDKSAAIVSCKTTVTTVRDYLGRTGIGPVAHLNADLARAFAKAVNDDDADATMDAEALDVLRQRIEDVQQALVRADALSYAARRDATAINNFDPSRTSQVLDEPGSNLAQCRRAVEETIVLLQEILQLLPPK